MTPRVRSRNAHYHISDFHKGRIVAYHDCGLLYHGIAALVGRDRATARRIWNRWVQDDNMTRGFTLYSSLENPYVSAGKYMTTCCWDCRDLLLNEKCSDVALTYTFTRSLTNRKWQSMVAELLVHPHTPVTMVDELWYRVEAAQAYVPVHSIQFLFDSMPRRISDVINATDDCSVTDFSEYIHPNFMKV
ncbi:hypothetical protein TNCV_2536501 [Trichonephila clavipes]|nr:hypothetical protein TNCV_2536501 [Trichonephila clavipes]